MKKLEADQFDAWLTNNCEPDTGDPWNNISDQLLLNSPYKDTFPTMYASLIDGVNFKYYLSRIRDRVALKRSNVAFRKIVIRSWAPHLRTKLLDIGLWTRGLQETLDKNIEEAGNCARATSTRHPRPLLEKHHNDFIYLKNAEYVDPFTSWVICFEEEGNPGKLIKDAPGVCTLGRCVIGGDGHNDLYLAPGRIVERRKHLDVFDSIHEWISGQRTHLLSH